MDKQLLHSESKFEKKTFPIDIIAHDIFSPINVGSLFRTADAFGIQKLYLSGVTPTPPQQKISKTSRSTEQYVDWKKLKDPYQLIADLKSQGKRIIALEITDQSIPLHDYQVPLDKDLCLIIGSENQGIHEDLLKLSDDILHLEMYGNNSSMNVIQATSICLYHLTNQKT